MIAISERCPTKSSTSSVLAVGSSQSIQRRKSLKSTPQADKARVNVPNRCEIDKTEFMECNLRAFTT